MARALRTDFPGAVHHVTSRGNERRPIFFDDRDREAFLDFLGQAVQRFGWSLTAYVLMTNHFHLVLQTPEPNLSRGMHWLNTAYVGWFNRRHERSGHLYGGRFKAFLIEKETYLLEVLRYVVLNPVRAQLVDRPENYRWSSFRATAGVEPAPEWLDVGAALEPFAPDRDLAQTYYQGFVAEKIGSDERLWDQLIHGIYLGSDQWARAMRKKVESKPRSTDHPKTQRAIGRPRMHEVIAAVGRAGGESAAAIRAMRGGSLRRLAAWIGWHEGWVTLRTIAAALRLRSEGHVSNLIRRCELEFSSSQPLLGMLDQALVTLRT
ncbi:MAG TPA: transposase [Thermoanaerobaculia bacterium]|nr:transposase [Thermoanaerobaculia bacterium]